MIVRIVESYDRVCNCTGIIAYKILNQLCTHIKLYKVCVLICLPILIDIFTYCTYLVVMH